MSRFDSALALLTDRRLTQAALLRELDLTRVHAPDLLGYLQQQVAAGTVVHSRSSDTWTATVWGASLARAAAADAGGARLSKREAIEFHRSAVLRHVHTGPRSILAIVEDARLSRRSVSGILRWLEQAGRVVRTTNDHWALRTDDSTPTTVDKQGHRVRRARHVRDQERVREAISADGNTAADIRDTSGLSLAVVTVALRSLRVAGVANRDNFGVWRLTIDQPDGTAPRSPTPLYRNEERRPEPLVTRMLSARW